MNIETLLQELISTKGEVDYNKVVKSLQNSLRKSEGWYRLPCGVMVALDNGCFEIAILFMKNDYILDPRYNCDVTAFDDYNNMKELEQYEHDDAVTKSLKDSLRNSKTWCRLPNNVRLSLYMIFVRMFRLYNEYSKGD